MEETKLPPIEFEEPQMTCGNGGGMWLIIAIFLGFVLAALTSCTSTKYIPVEKVVTDSIFFRDTLIQKELIPYRDSVSSPDTTSWLSNPYAYSRATWSGGRLHHVLGIWPTARVDVSVPNYAVRVRTVTTDKIVEVEKKLTWWQQTKLDYAELSGLLNLLLIFIVIWLVKKKGRER